MTKAPDAFRTISEVAAELDLPQHVLRFWESRFPQIKPMKRGGGRRYYRPDDVELLCGIRHLLYGQGYTIRGVQRILREQGPRFVQSVWQAGAPQPEPAADQDMGEGEGEVEVAEADDRDDREDQDTVRAEPAPVPRVEPRFETLPEVEPPPVREEARREPTFESYAASDHAEAVAAPIQYQDEDDAAAEAEAETEIEAEVEAETEVGNGYDRVAPAPEPAPVPGLTDTDRERLTIALEELAECRRLLDGALVDVEPEA